jgi:DNA-binding transcriptional LysR family regulator
VELRHLRYFVAAAETENVSRAALKLHVSQPALSRQIRDLEDEIGFCLLERTAKSVRLTEAGRAFLNDARALLQHADEAVKKARAVASAEPTAPRRLLTDASRRNSAENLTGISAGDAKRARQIARLEQQSHSRWDTRWPTSTRIDSFSPEG